MTFQEWFNSAPHRAKYSNDHPAYLAAQEAWETAHEACAKVCDGKEREKWEQMAKVLTGGLGEIHPIGPKECAAAIRARSKHD